MNGVIHLEENKRATSWHNPDEELKIDIQTGLSAAKKIIQSKYFYDDYGSELFNRITRHPDYYLTRCELEILKSYKHHLATIMQQAPFNLVELGPGEGIKTQLLIETFLRERLQFRYLPIDISSNFLDKLQQQLCGQLPDLQVAPLHADFFRGLEWLKEHSHRQNLVLFLGSSIGNFNHDAAHNFLLHLSSVLNPGDYVLIGFDLRKDMNVLLRAYDDVDGITREFNMNLLRRLNRELHANFNLNKFKHYATYNVQTGAMESYLLSLEEQVVHVDAIYKDYHFNVMEGIHVESSHKYLLSQINELAEKNNFELVQNFFDGQHYFTDSLWRVHK